MQVRLILSRTRADGLPFSEREAIANAHAVNAILKGRVFTSFEGAHSPDGERVCEEVFIVDTVREPEEIPVLAATCSKLFESVEGWLLVDGKPVVGTVPPQ